MLGVGEPHSGIFHNVRDVNQAAVSAIKSATLAKRNVAEWGDCRHFN